MSQLSEHHKTLTNGVGKCSVPMWIYPGCPAGFCDEPAYGERPESKGGYWRNAHTGERHRMDGKYNGYVPALACPAHGGSTLQEAREGQRNPDPGLIEESCENEDYVPPAGEAYHGTVPCGSCVFCVAATAIREKIEQTKEMTG